MCKQVFGVLGAILLLTSSCTQQQGPSIDGQDVQITFLHTTDIHSRLVPYTLEVGEVDDRLGLVQELEPFGGAARLAYIIGRERSQSGRVLHLDTGDAFQGAPIFNFFSGEVEMRLLSIMHVDSMVMGNHEFDLGGVNLYNQIDNWAHFPMLAANYRWEDPELPYNSHLGEVSHPYTIYNVVGLRVAIIGLANLSSMNSIWDTGNRLGITPLDTFEICQYYVDFLKPQVDLIVVNSHIGLSADEELIEHVSNMDVVLGGHHHVMLNPPKEVHDPLGRIVPMAHSGAFAKYVGRYDVVVRQCSRISECVRRYEELGIEVPTNDWEVVSTEYTVFPVDSSVPQDEFVLDVLEDYTLQMDREIDLNQLIGYAPNMVRRFGTTGGDSALGNLVATAMRQRRGVETDFSLTNTLGIRADFVPGPVSIEQMFNVFPFENTIATVNLSGAEVQELFDFVTDRSSGRGCSTQAQIAGSVVIMDCSSRTVRRVLIDDASPAPIGECPAVQEAFNACCEDVIRCGCSVSDCTESTCEELARQNHPDCDPDYEPFYNTNPCPDDDECIARGDNQRCFIPDGSEQGKCMYAVVDNYELVDPYGIYGLAANDYIARGGSGFRVLGRNTSSQDLGIPLRDVLVDYIRAGQPCTDNDPCETDTDCPTGQICACDAMSDWNNGDKTCSWDSRECGDGPRCSGQSGSCVLAACVEDVTEFRGDRIMTCENAWSSNEDQIEGFRQECWCSVRRWALHECQELSCIDDRLGAVSDGRQTMVQP